jgi:DNA-binding MarR family transcriptional regulator
VIEPDARFRAWYATLQASTRALERIERDVEGATGIPISWLEVLFSLKKGPVRMSDLADQSLLSRGGASRLIARMEQADLVTRTIPPEDRRATFAELTKKGWATLERIAPVHAEAVQRYFSAAIDDDEAEQLRQISVRVLELVGERCDWLIEDLRAGAEAPDNG